MTEMSDNHPRVTEAELLQGLTETHRRYIQCLAWLNAQAINLADGSPFPLDAGTGKTASDFRRNAHSKYRRAMKALAQHLA